MKKITIQQGALMGAFLMDGFKEVDQPGLLEKWDRGFYELVDELTQYAEPIWNVAEVGGEVTGDFPGVFDYEVTIEIGKKFAEYILSGEGTEPPRKEVEKWVVDEAHKFFMQGEKEDANPGLKAILSLAFRGILRG